MRFFLKVIYTMAEMKTVGSRAEVMHGTAKKTSGGLMKRDLAYNKWGSIVSKKKAELAKKQKHLEKAGWTAKKGKFGAVRMEKKSKKGGYKKGSMSKTHKGELDFTTKKSSKVFHRKGKYERRSAKGVSRKPYHKRA